MTKQKTLLEFIKKSESLKHQAGSTKSSESTKENLSIEAPKESVNLNQHQQPAKPMSTGEAKAELLVDKTSNIDKQSIEEREYPRYKRFDYLDFRVYIPEALDLDNEKIFKFYREPRYVDSANYAYLLDVKYNGDLGKAVLVLYDVNSNDLLYYYDKTGHKPYFLTDIPPEKINKIPEIVRHKSFDSIETVEKFDPLRNAVKRFTKIVVKDPIAVRSLRNKVPIAWEANIRYHVNYIYDLGLIPGMPYKIEGAKIEEIVEIDLESLRENIIKVLDISNPQSLETAVNLAKLFETKWVSARRVAIDIEVYTPFEGRVPSPDDAVFPIISIAFFSNDGLRKVFILNRENLKVLQKLPEDVEVEVFDSELHMILESLLVISRYSVVLTFNGDNFDLRYLYVRALKLGIPKELIGIKIKKVVKGGRKIEYVAELVHGIHLDLYKFFNNKAIQTYAFEGRYKEVNLDSVAQALLGIGKVQLDEELGKVDLSTLVRYNSRDAQITLELTTFADELVWKLVLLIMRISKLGMEDVCRTTVSVWIKNLFYWEHRQRKYLIPRPEDIVSLKGKKVTEAIIKGKKYAGAIVIDPPQGMFFNVFVLDFASLYPSIIKRWNLSYETIDPEPSYCNKLADIVDEKDKVIHHVCLEKAGITSEVVGFLRDLRVRIYKKKAKDRKLDEAYRSWYDVVQRAMKVYINAAYGVFGAKTFTLYAPSVAESVTALGRRIITTTIAKAEELGLKVLYGDTDSLFVWNPDPTKLEELRRWVELTYGLELEMDKVYKFIAFALKKNYVGILTSGEIDIKGMVGKKRNTPDFIKNLFNEIIKQIASINEPEDAIKVVESVRRTLEKYYISLRYRLLTLDEVAFHVGLTKSLPEYEKTTPQHVKAALMLQRYGIEVSSGDIITYIKVKSKEGVKPIQLAKVSEIDVQKYLEAMRTTLEQLFTALNISWEDIAGSSKIM
ncbi:MAG: DNA-directed DNA polymerase I [Ignisphaera sp.]|uniref:DNA polymerase n=1 Tax=Ignisphaera aggregans TaxID=334771 RepID=A0A7C4JK90_9CREN